MNEAAARVLGALRSAAGPCSGETLSASLGVSRAQVWKHVEQLRKRGYKIDGEPGGQAWPVTHSASCTTGADSAALALDGDTSTYWNPHECTSPWWVIYDFKRFVIEPALQDINKTSDMWVRYTQRKTGRRVTHLTFEFGLKSTPKTKPKRLTKKYIEQNSFPGESWENAKKRLSEEVV